MQTDLGDLEWHTITTEEVARRLSSSPNQGLESVQVDRKLKEHGKNTISPPPKNLLKKLVKYVLGGFGTLLLVAAIICFISWSVRPRYPPYSLFLTFNLRKPLGEPPAASDLALAVVLLIVVALQAVFNAQQDYSTSRILESITGMLPAEVTVLRNGSVARIPSADLVPGDIVDLSLGQKVPADLRVGLHF